MPRAPRVFLAAPYSQWMNHSTGTVEPLWRTRLDTLRHALMERGAEVFNAHHNEAWGVDWLSAEVCTPVDFAAMRLADAVCAVIGQPLSGGVAVELGWASALGRPTLLVVPPGAPGSPLIAGLGMVTRTRYLDEPTIWRQQELAAIATATLAMVEPGTLERELGTGPPPQGSGDTAGLPGGVLDTHVACCSQLQCDHVLMHAGNSRIFLPVGRMPAHEERRCSPR
jgi:nucleoside 2-deoxyribosyltransferase